mmetsp:Transcript_24865/g.61971  ORF Transcript_24865/g.61971 Transcript_24865/m.61971 type:complete len:415 (-) Transcript_24865:1232-2476(-)
MHLLGVVAHLGKPLGAGGCRKPDVRVAVRVQDLGHVAVLNCHLEYVPVHVVDEHLNFARKFLDDVVVGVRVLLGVERRHVRDAHLDLLGGGARRLGVLQVRLVVVNHLDDAHALAVVAEAGGGNRRRLAAGVERPEALRVLARHVAVELHLNVRLDAAGVPELEPRAKLRLKLGELVALEAATIGVGGDDVGSGHLSAALLLRGEAAGVPNLNGVFLEVRHGGHRGGGAEVRAVLVVRVQRLKLGLRRAPRLVRVLGLGGHEDAQVIVVVRYVLRGIYPPVLLTLLGVPALDVVKGVELHSERLAQAVGALLPLTEVVDGVGLFGVGVAEAVGGAPDESVGDVARVEGVAVPAVVGVVVRVLLPRVVGDDEREAVAAVADLIFAAALARVGDLKHKVGLEAVPDVYLAVPPHGP